MVKPHESKYNVAMIINWKSDVKPDENIHGKASDITKFVEQHNKLLS